MSRPLADAAALALALDRNGDEPLAAQMTRQLRALILGGRLRDRARLPSSRTLAIDLGVSRATIVEAFEQLASEGFVEGRRGAGVFVSPGLVGAAERRAASAPSPAARRPVAIRPFELGAVDPDLAPFGEFSKLLRNHWRRPSPALLGRVDGFGWPELRAAVARHLEEWRGFVCDAERIVVTAGSADAMGLLARLVLTVGDAAVVEDPGYGALRAVLLDHGARLLPVQVDAEGLDPRALPDARLALTTPSRQFPLGGTMPVARRLELIDWAERQDALVVEDDFDSEYRYVGAPLPALASLDGSERVAYLGSFSKALFSSLRLGFVVLPARLVEPARVLLQRRATPASLIAQPALAELIRSGHYAQHIRRSRRIYARRLTALNRASRGWEDVFVLKPTDAGLHVVADLSPDFSDREVRAALAQAGVTVGALSDYYLGRPRRPALLLNFAAFTEHEIVAGVARMGAALRAMMSPNNGDAD